MMGAKGRQLWQLRRSYKHLTPAEVFSTMFDSNSTVQAVLARLESTCHALADTKLAVEALYHAEIAYRLLNEPFDMDASSVCVHESLARTSRTVASKAGRACQHQLHSNFQASARDEDWQQNIAHQQNILDFDDVKTSPMPV